MGSVRHVKGVPLLLQFQLDLVRCLLTSISSHMSVHGAAALCTLSEVTSLLLDAWPALANYSCALGWGLGVCQAMAREWPEGKLPWILLPSQLSLAEVAKVETVAKPRSWCPLEQMVFPAGHLPIWLPSFLGSPSSSCPFCFPSWTSSLPHAPPPVPSDPI